MKAGIVAMSQQHWSSSCCYKMANLPATETFPEPEVCLYIENSKQLSGEGILWNPSRLNGGSVREGMPPSTGKIAR